jgi:hypothetical protein
MQDRDPGRSPRRRRPTATIVALALALLLPALLFGYILHSRNLDQDGPTVTGELQAPAGGFWMNPRDGAAPGAVQQPYQAVDLGAATLTLGTWRPSPVGSPPCPTGGVTFAAGSATVPGMATVRLQQNALVDVDHDGTNEIAVVVSCEDSQAGTFQAIVLKPASGGLLTTMGQLARSGPAGDDIVAVAPGAGGVVDLTVGNIIPCCGTPASMQLTQVRGYAWQRGRFAQVAGPTTFTVDHSAVKLAISAPAVALSGLTGGKSSGTLTVTIRNTGSRAAGGVSVAVWAEQPLAPAVGRDWVRCLTRDGTNRARVCPIGRLPVGGSATLTLPFTGLFGRQTITVEPRIGDQVYATLHVASSYS